MHVSKGVCLSGESTKACDRAGGLMSACASKARINISDSMRHVEIQISDTSRKIIDLQSRLIALNEVNTTRGGSKIRIHYAALNSGSRTTNMQVENDNADSIKNNVESAVNEKLKHDNELRDLAKESEDFNSIFGPITTADFHQHARKRLQPIFTKQNKLCSSDCNRDKSLGCTLHSSKRALKANKIFDIV